MVKKKIFSEILQKIKKDQIKPIPKWQCQLINGAFWLAVVGAVILSSLFFSVVLINIFELPFEIFHHIRIGQYPGIFFRLFPFVWLSLIIIASFLSLMALHKTRYGYRYGFALLASILLTIILMFGFVLHQLRVNQPLRDFTENRIPPSFRGGPFNKAQNEIFVEDGLLGGEIIKKTENKIFIKNLVKEKWEVGYDDKTKIKRRTELKVGDKIIVVGEKQGGFSFKAFVIKKIEGRPDCRTPQKLSK